jgi:hypothetical protein
MFPQMLYLLANCVVLAGSPSNWLAFGFKTRISFQS